MLLKKLHTSLEQVAAEMLSQIPEISHRVHSLSWEGPTRQWENGDG